MGLADFFATAGRGSVVGNIAEAFGGGRSVDPRQEGFNKAFLQIRDEMDATKSVQEIRDVGTKALKTWSAAGLPLNEKAINVLNIMTKEALNGLQDRELDALQRDYGSRPGEAAPENVEGPLTAGGFFIDPREARNPLADPEGAMRFGRAIGANPEQFRHMLEAPAEIKAKQASTAMTERNLAKSEEESQHMQGLPSEPVAGVGISPRQLARSPSLATLFPQREPSSGAMDLKRQGLEIQQQRLAALADRVAAGLATAAERAELARELLAFEKAKFEQQKQGTETVATTEAADPVRDRKAQIILQQQAEEAGIGKLPPAEQGPALKKMASNLGYEIEGTPTLGKVGGTLGFGGEPAVVGITGWKRKPTTSTTTKAPAGQRAAPTPQGGTVMMEAPDGSKRAVPAARVEEFKRKGAKVVGQ